MNQKHKHAELIKAWADGAAIQTLYKTDGEWHDKDEPLWSADREYRIKPEPKYPETRMTAMDLYETYKATDEGDSGWDELIAVANIAIRRAIQDGDVVLPEGKA